MAAPTHTKTTKWDRIEADLVSTLESDIDGTATASTTVDVESASGQAVLKVTATTGFVVNKTAIMDAGNANSSEEVASVSSISTGDSLTLATNLQNTQAVGVAVKQDWYNYDMQHVITVDRPEDLGPSHGLQWPYCKMYVGPEIPVEYLTGYNWCMRNVFLVMWIERQFQQGTTQRSDEEYQMGFADMEKAISADWTLGGNASIVRLGQHERVTDDAYPVDPEEEDEQQGLDLVGVLLPIEIEYMQKRGDAYA